MKKSISLAAAVAAMAMAFTACNNETPKVEERSAQTSGTTMKIAYVEVDSIMTQYKYCKEYTLILEKKSQNIQNTLNKKGSELQTAVTKFQQDIQNNRYTQQQAEQVQANLQRQQAELQALQQKLSMEFQTETETFNKALRDSIQHYLTAYNKDMHYSLILTKQGDNILYADKAYDITREIVAGLNKAYKGKAGE